MHRAQDIAVRVNLGIDTHAGLGCYTMRLLRGSRVVCVLLLLASRLSFPPTVQSAPNVPDQYKRLFFQYSDQRSWYEKALNSIGLTGMPVGRSCALIAGVTEYPNFPAVSKSLRPAEVDIQDLKSYLRDQEFFDEIVVLKDGDMTLDNLDYFLGESGHDK
jgi:hypothetical protein